MTDFLSFFFVLGASIVDRFEVWTLALFASVVLIDVIIGFRWRAVALFNILQCVGLVCGYLWASAVFGRQDVSGPYAWALVVGLWAFAVISFHVLCILYAIIRKRAHPRQ